MREDSKLPTKMLCMVETKNSKAIPQGGNTGIGCQFLFYAAIAFVIGAILLFDYRGPEDPEETDFGSRAVPFHLVVFVAGCVCALISAFFLWPLLRMGSAKVSVEGDGQGISLDHDRFGSFRLEATFNGNPLHESRLSVDSMSILADERFRVEDSSRYELVFRFGNIVVSSREHVGNETLFELLDVTLLKDEQSICLLRYREDKTLSITTDGDNHIVLYRHLESFLVGISDVDSNCFDGLFMSMRIDMPSVVAANMLGMPTDYDAAVDVATGEEVQRRSAGTLEGIRWAAEDAGPLFARLSRKALFAVHGWGLEVTLPQFSGPREVLKRLDPQQLPIPPCVVKVRKV